MFAANPTKEFTVSFPELEVREAIKKIIKAEPSKYSLVKEDEILNEIRIHEKITAWDQGYHIDFVLKKISNSETAVRLEVSRKVGALDEKHEIHNANYIVKEISDKFSAYLSGNVDSSSGKANIPENKGCILLISSIGLVGFLFYLFS